MNILIVEDENIMALLLRKILEKISLTNIVEVASGFDEAKEKLRSNIFDIALMDINLGKDSFTGTDLCRFIRKKDKEIILIMVTGYHSVEKLEKAFQAGANDYIKKPFQRKELLLRVKQWMLMAHKVIYREYIDYKGLLYDFNKNNFFF